MTYSVNIFLAASEAVRQGIDMLPQSRNDKEYFAQNWFIDRLASIDLPYSQQGRNSYPDFWVGDEGNSPLEGYEVKSLSFANGKPARKDFDSNSTIPSGRKQDRDVFLVFFLYTGKGRSLRTVHSLNIAHTDVINADHALAARHANEAIRGFGSYGDGFIRNRKMYVFPHLFSIDPDAIGRCRLVVPAEWNVQHEGLTRAGTIERTVSAKTISGYAIDLRHQGQAEVKSASNPAAGTLRSFDVFEAADS